MPGGVPDIVREVRANTTGEDVIRRYGAGAAVLVIGLISARAADCQELLRSLESTGGGLERHVSGVRMLSATGLGPAIGRSVDPQTGLIHTGGWVSLDPILVGDEAPLRLTNVQVRGVTPDSAVVTFTSSLPVRALLEYGETDAYGATAEVARGEAVRVTGLDAGGLYHFKLTVIDRFGRRRRTGDNRICTPAFSEITRGLIQADYYRGREFDSLVTSRPEATIDQPDRSDGDRLGDFGSGAGPDNFSVRWKGFVQIDSPGSHSWRTRHDDGLRLWVDGQPIMDAWREAGGTRQTSARSQLDRSWHSLELEYFNGVGPAIMELDLGGPGIRLGALPSNRIAHVNKSFYAPSIEPRDAPTLECTSPAGARVRLPAPEVFDCHDPAPRVSSDAPNTMPLGLTRVVWTAQNRLGNLSRLVEQVEVIDTQPPVLDPPAPVVVEARNPLGTVVPMPTPTAFDRCDEELDYSYHLCQAGGAACQACWTAADEAADPAKTAGARNNGCDCVRLPGRLDVGTVNVTVIGADDEGNCGSARFDVTVRDTTPPSIAVGDVEFVCQEAPIPRATLRDNATADDDIGVTCSIDGGAPQSCDGTMSLSNGDHTVRYVATDAAGLTASATLEFNVGDADPVPPTATLRAATTGYVGGEARVTLRVRDNCDVDPTVAFDPAGEASRDGDDHTVTYTDEGRYPVRVTATDDAGNSSAFTVPVFAIDLTPPVASYSGLDALDDPDDHLSWPAFFPEETVGFAAGASDRLSDIQSGIARLSAVLIHLDSGDERVLLDRLYDAEGGPPAAGPTRLKNVACAEVLNRGDVPYCDADGNLAMAELAEGEYELVVTTLDHAGNGGTVTRNFVLLSWRIAIERALAIAERLLEEEQDAIVELFLDLVVDIADDALFALGEPRTRGNALLYTFTMISSLDFAASQGVDTGDAQAWLSQGALDGIRQREREVDAQGPVDVDDFEQAGVHLRDAEDSLASDSHAASVLSLMNALFRLEHALAPYVIDRWEDASAATFRLRNEMADYGAIDDINGAAQVAELHGLTVGIINDNLFGRAIAGGDVQAANSAFLDLLVELATLSDLLRVAQDDEWVWTRNWQWPVSLQVRTMAGLAIQSAALALRDDPDNPQDELLSYTAEQYDLGVGFIEGRLVDDALQIYVDNRCLIFEVYNHAGIAPQGIPPQDWGCEDCVLSGDCQRD